MGGRVGGWVGGVISGWSEAVCAAGPRQAAAESERMQRVAPQDQWGEKRGMSRDKERRRMTSDGAGKERERV